MRRFHRILQGIFLLLFVAGVVLSAAGAVAMANQRAHTLQSLFALEKHLVAPSTDVTQIKEKSREHMASVDEGAARQRTAFYALGLGVLALIPGFLGLTIYTGVHLLGRPVLTERDAIWKLRRNEQYALCLLILGLTLAAFGGSKYVQSTREQVASAIEASALAARLADADISMSNDLMSQATRFRQHAINTMRQGTNALTCMSLGFTACGVGFVALWFMTARRRSLACGR